MPPFSDNRQNAKTNSPPHADVRQNQRIKDENKSRHISASGNQRSRVLLAFESLAPSEPDEESENQNLDCKNRQGENPSPLPREHSRPPGLVNQRIAGPESRETLLPEDLFLAGGSIEGIHFSVVHFV